MPDKQRAKARALSCTPIHITEWDGFYVEAGVLYVVFRSGATQHCVTMGPHVAIDGIQQATGALTGGGVLPFARTPAPAH